MTTRLLRRPEVQRRVGIARSTIYQMMSDGHFPKPIRIGARSVAWVESDVEAWIAGRMGVCRSADPAIDDPRG